MWRNTKKTIRWAPHRWMFRVSSPNVTSLWMSRMFEYASIDDGT